VKIKIEGSQLLSTTLAELKSQMEERVKEAVTLALKPTGSWKIPLIDDVPTLQHYLRECNKAHDRSIKRLQKARAQRNAAQEDARQLRAELNLLLKQKG
jgi:hypothetical protein